MCIIAVSHPDPCSLRLMLAIRRQVQKAQVIADETRVMARGSLEADKAESHANHLDHMAQISARNQLMNWQTTLEEAKIFREALTRRLETEHNEAVQRVTLAVSDTAVRRQHELRIATIVAQKKLAESLAQAERECISLDANVQLVKLNTVIADFGKMAFFQTEIEWLAQVQMMNRHLQEVVLPEVQAQFVMDYTRSVEARNGVVKNIHDEVKLPRLVCDGDPTRRLYYLVPGEVIDKSHV